VILGIDSVIRRLEEHVEYHEQHPGAWEVPDYEEYGETLSEHMQRVNALEREYDEASLEWRRQYRPDLLDRPNEIQKSKDKIDAEIVEIEEEIARLSTSNDKGGGG